MCPSTEATEAQREFAAGVLRNLLRRIDKSNDEGRYTAMSNLAQLKQ